MKAALDYMPEITINVGADGELYTSSKVSQSERGVVGDIAGPEMVGGGHVELISNKLVRPSKIHVLFQYEPEVRFDFDEGSSTDVTDDTPYLENVLPLPDFTIKIDDVDECQGTWITIPEALSVWTPVPGFGSALTIADLRKMAIPFNGLRARIGILGGFEEI